MENTSFRLLSESEEASFRLWARKNYIPGQEVSSTWHPETRHECEQMNIEEIMKIAAKTNPYWPFKSQKWIGDTVEIPEEGESVSIVGVSVINDTVTCECLAENGEIQLYDLEYLNSI